MATKTFKIGLSDTDKQNMAQDIYEQVESLLFEEYDSTETYNEGDYTVYENSLYRCLDDGVTGAWNSAKWENATLQDLVDDVNGAVASVNGKANIIDLENGTLVVAKSLTAKDFEPVSEESGAFQDSAFISQGTGTDNNTSIVDTSDVAKQIEKQGNTYAVNQLVQNGNFVDTSSWSIIGGTFSVSNNVGLVEIPANTNFGFYQSVPNKIAGHKMLIILDIVSTSSQNIDINWGVPTSVSFTATATKQKIFKIFDTPSSGNNNINFTGETSSAVTLSFSHVNLIDLTQMFNGDIPQYLLDNPSHFSWYYNGDLSYNEGELVNASGRYLVCGQSRNLFAGNDTESSQYIGHYYIDNTFARQTNADYNCYRLSVIPNRSYFIGRSGGSTLSVSGGIVRYLDKDLNLLGGTTDGYSSKYAILTTPANCQYIEFSLYKTTANNTVVELYYTSEQGGEGYLDNGTPIFYDYVASKTYDTGTEVLRSIPVPSGDDIRDIKTPDGTIHRLVGRYTFTGSESWTQNGQAYQSNIPSVASSIKKPASTAYAANLVCPILVNTYASNLYNNGNTISGIAVDADGYIRIGAVDYPNVSSLTGKTIYFELATPTTEQGAAFAENIEINDYGIMYWLDTSSALVGIPQGVKVFYPAWYAGFVDSLGSRTNWHASDVVIQSELSAEETARSNQDTILLNAIGGTLRQCLCVKETLDFDNTNVVDLGSLTWTKADDGKFYADMDTGTFPGTTTGTPKIISTKYKTAERQTFATLGDKLITLSGSDSYYAGRRILIRDDTYTDATVFKNAMKGILLAYEKA